ncbi:UNKNOWN [Stylonychia lemnae]|uniref:Uncharacterized protein n=1 Tax=Stylonychia lemnae TaxID=5949 RepID=A0A078ALZ4_STYLE|nr:UNKNOWN [Stylonychia lemnae]|eukprot:CDW82432.1 UNKNOWN [Stylonychia lemnae]
MLGSEQRIDPLSSYTLTQKSDDLDELSLILAKELQTNESLPLNQTNSGNDSTNSTDSDEPNQSMTDLDILAKKALGKNDELALKKSQQIVFMCNKQQNEDQNINEQIDQTSVQEILCHICNTSRGIILRSNKRNEWQNHLKLTESENNTFNEIYDKLQGLFLDSNYVFSMNGYMMCFASDSLPGQYSMKKLSRQFDDHTIDNSDIYFDGQDTIEPTLLTLRYILNPESKEIEKTHYQLQVKIPLRNNHIVVDHPNDTNIFNFTLTDQVIDRFLTDQTKEVAYLQGKARTQVKNLTIPVRIYIDLSNGEKQFLFEPYSGTTNVQTFLDIFMVNSSYYQDLPIPKGISSIFSLPVYHAIVQFESDQLSNEQISFKFILRLEINFIVPVDFRFMPRLGLSDASGSIFIDYPERDALDISLFLNGITVLNKTQVFGTTIQKSYLQDSYTTVMRAIDQSYLSITYLKDNLFRSFNVIDQDFWPVDDRISMSIINSKMQLENKVIEAPIIRVSWLPKQMQIFEGYTSIYGKNDAEIFILMANLAGTTLQNTHLVFKGDKSLNAFQNTFNLGEFHSFSELKSFDIQRFTVTFTNQDIDLNLWPDVKESISFEEDNIWIEGVQIALNLELKKIEDIADLFPQSFARIFKKFAINSKSNQEFEDIENIGQSIRMSGSLLNEQTVKLEGIIGEQIQLSSNVMLHDAKFVMSFPINFIQKKKVSKHHKDEKSKHKSINNSTVDSYIEGRVQIQVEPGRYLNFFAKIDSSNDEWISLDGQMTGLYTNVLGVQNLHLSQIKIHGQIDNEAQIRNITIYGQGLFGQECLQLSKSQKYKTKNNDIMSLLDLVAQDSESPQFTLSQTDASLRALFERQLNNQSKEILSLNQNCFMGDIKNQIDLQNFEYSFLKGHLWVETFKTLLQFVITDREKFERAYKSLINPITELKFSNGIDFSFNPGKTTLKYVDQEIPKGFRFQGNIKFLGLDSETTIDFTAQSRPSYQKVPLNDHQYLNIKFQLPSFTVGHQNVQILSFQDFYVAMTSEEEKRVSKNPIQVSVQIDIDSESSIADIEQIQMIGNVKVLDFMTQAQLVVDDNQLSFTTNNEALPFNGVFQAQISMQIDLNHLTDISIAPSTLNVTFKDTTPEFSKIRDLVDKLVYQTWIKPVSQTFNQYHQRVSEILSKINLMKTELCDVRSCVQQSQCISEPKLLCKEYKIVEQCEKEKQSCPNHAFDMVCQTLKRGVALSNDATTDVCQAWTYECSKDSQFLLNAKSDNICVESKYSYDFENCIDFTIDCERGYIQDSYCLAKCTNTKNEYERLEKAERNFQVVADAAGELFGPIHALSQTRNNTNGLLIHITSIEIDQELDRTLNPSEYIVTVRYVVINQLDQPREVSVPDFDYLYIDVAAERVAQAIRKDMSVLFNLSASFGDFMPIALQNLDKFMLYTGNQTLTVDIIKQSVIQETQKQALHIDGLKTQRVIKVATPGEISLNKLGQATSQNLEITSLANKFVKKNDNSQTKIPSGLDSINYDLGKINAINQ